MSNTPSVTNAWDNLRSALDDAANGAIFDPVEDREASRLATAVLALLDASKTEEVVAWAVRESDGSTSKTRPLPLAERDIAYSVANMVGGTVVALVEKSSSK